MAGIGQLQSIGGTISAEADGTASKQHPLVPLSYSDSLTMWPDSLPSQRERLASETTTVKPCYSEHKDNQKASLILCVRGAGSDITMITSNLRHCALQNSLLQNFRFLNLKFCTSKLSRLAANVHALYSHARR